MKVRAKGEDGVVVGYFDHRRVRGGQVLEVNEKKYKGKDGKVICEFSPNWMEKVSDDARSVPYVKQPLREPVPLKDANKSIHEGKIEKPEGKKEELEEIVDDKPAKTKKAEVKPEAESTGNKDVI